MGKILVIRGGAIGDFVLTLPAIRLLAEDLPEAELEIMGYAPIIALAQAGGYARRTRSIEYGAMASFFANGAKLDEELCRYFAGFSVVVSYLYDPDHHFRDNLRRAGVDTLIECSHKVDDRGAPAAEQLAKPLESLALYLDGERSAPKLEIGGEARREAEVLLGEYDQIIALHPGSGSPYKNWDLAHWTDVMHRLHERHPEYRFLVSTGEAEEERVAAFFHGLERFQFPVTPANRLPLDVLGAALVRCRLYLGHDSGISHLAAAMGVPSVVLFGPTPSAVWAPPHAHVAVVEHKSGLLSAVTVQEVVETAEELLAQGSGTIR